MEDLKLLKDNDHGPLFVSAPIFVCHPTSDAFCEANNEQSRSHRETRKNVVRSSLPGFRRYVQCLEIYPQRSE